MRYTILILSFVIACYPLNTAWAKKKGVEVEASELIEVNDPEYGQYVCRATKKGFAYGKKKTTPNGKVRFIPDRRDKRQANKFKKQRRDQSLPPKKRKTAGNKFKDKKAEIASKKAKCAEAAGGGNGGGSGSGGGNTPTRNLLAPLSRAVTITDLNKLLERAAFGRGSATAETIVNVGLSSGLQAAIDSLTTRRQESSTVMAMVNDWMDGELDLEDGTDREDTDDDGTIDEGLSISGIENGMFYHAMTTTNPFFYKFSMDILLPQFTINHGGFYVQPGSDFTHERWNQLYYYQDLLTKHSNEGDIKAMADELLTSRLFLEQYQNTSNTKDQLGHVYGASILRHILPVRTDSLGRPNFTNNDVVELSKVLTGWMSFLLEDQILGAFSTVSHERGNKTLFAGTDEECIADRFRDYKRCAFADDSTGLSRYYSRKLLEYYLTPDPSEELVAALAQVIRENEYKLVPAVKVLFASEEFYKEEHHNASPKNIVELMVGFAQALGLPTRTGEDANQGESLRIVANRTGYIISRMPHGGYPLEMAASPQTIIAFRNFMEQTWEDVEAETRFYGDWGYDLEVYKLNQDEVRSTEQIDHVIAVLGLDKNDFPPQAIEALKYYILHRRLSTNTEDIFAPFDNRNDDLGKVMGSFVTISLTMANTFK